MRLKAIEEDAVESVSENYLKMAQNDSRQISFLLSGCERSTEIFRKAFWFNGEILSSGTPRMDLLFSKDKDLSMRIRTFLNLQEGEHVVLYAPTFREHIISDVGSLDLERLQLLLNKKWGGAWRILLRLHPHLKNQVSNYIGNKSFVLDVTCYDDVEELLYISDVIVSDYSSLIFDFLVTKRPCFLFTPDLKEYLEKERHLYYKLEDLPFPIIANNEAMERVLDSFDEYDYREKASAFLRHVGSYETGHACENVYRAIVNHLS